VVFGIQVLAVLCRRSLDFLFSNFVGSREYEYKDVLCCFWTDKFKLKRRVRKGERVWSYDPRTRTYSSRQIQVR